MAKQHYAYFKERSEKGVKIVWEFSRQTARQKLHRRYSQLNIKILSNLGYSVLSQFT